LSDLDMPDRDGFDLLESVRETDPDLAFILFTSHESEGIIEQALESGATDYFPKSMTNTSYRLLAHRIEQAVRVSEADRTETADAEPEAEAVGVPRTDIDPGSRERGSTVEKWTWPSDVDKTGTDDQSTAAATPEGEVDRTGITPDSRGDKAPKADATPKPEAGVVAADSGLGIEIESATEPDRATVEATSETAEATTDRMEATAGETTDDRADEDTTTGGFVFPSEMDEDRERPDRQAGDTPSDGDGVEGESRSGDDGTEVAADLATTAVETSESEWKADVANGESDPGTDVATAASVSAVSPAESTIEESETNNSGIEIVGRTETDRTETEISSTAATDAGGDEELAAKLNLVDDEADGGTEAATKVGATEPDADETDVETVGVEADAGTGTKLRAGDGTGTEGAERDAEIEGEREPDADETSTETTASTEPDTEGPPEDPPATDDATEPESTRPVDGHEHVEEDLLGGFEPQPGEGILVECRSRDDRKGHACLDLLGLGDVEGRNVLLIRYKQIGEDRLRRIAEDAADIQLITIGYRQSIPNDVDEHIETTRISNPGELTRLGIVMTRAIGSWDGDDRDTVVCLDSLDVLMGYTDDRNVFRFLHVLLSKLQSSDAIAHFHIEPSTADDQGANTLKPLFDAIVTIDDDGVRIE